MNAKQKNIRIFELTIESEDEFFSYMEKNIVLLKEYMLLINGSLNEKMREYLDKNGCCYKSLESCNIKLNAKEISKKKEPQKIELVQYIEVEENSKHDLPTLVYHTPIRSGTIIEHDGDIAIFGRVNSGAKVICEGNLSIFGTIDGVVECNGKYMILKEINKGYALFNGDILDKESLDTKLKIVTSSKDGVVIKDLD